MKLDRSLAQLGDRLTKARDELRIVEEQLLFQMDVVEETKVRMLVAETPLAEREHTIATEDYHRLLKEQTRVTAEIQELQREQDRLLDLKLSTNH